MNEEEERRKQELEVAETFRQINNSIMKQNVKYWPTIIQNSLKK